MMSEIWPVLKADIFECPAEFSDLIKAQWKQKFSFEKKTCVRFVVYDVVDAQWEVVGDFGGVGYQDGIPTVVIEWRNVVRFLKYRPGIDVIIFEAATMRKTGCLSLFHHEYAVVLALLHIFRWIRTYPCDLMVVFPEKKHTFETKLAQSRLEAASFHRPYSHLVLANSNRILFEGPKVVMFGKGQDAKNTFRSVDPKNMLKFAVPAGTLLHIDSGAEEYVLPRLQEGFFDMVFSNHDLKADVLVGSPPTKGMVFLSGSGNFRIQSGRTFIVLPVNNRASVTFEEDEKDIHSSEIAYWVEGAWLSKDFFTKVKGRTLKDSEKDAIRRVTLVMEPVKV
eukprot:jgi/Mesvir1/1272/Mv09560-RA.1